MIYCGKIVTNHIVLSQCIRIQVLPLHWDGVQPTSAVISPMNIPHPEKEIAHSNDLRYRECANNHIPKESRYGLFCIVSLKQANININTCTGRRRTQQSDELHPIIEPSVWRLPVYPLDCQRWKTGSIPRRICQSLRREYRPPESH